MRQVRARVGIVFQNFNLFPHLTALGNAMEAPMTVKKTDAAPRPRRSRATISSGSGCPGKEQLYPAQLSGGSSSASPCARAGDGTRRGVVRRADLRARPEARAGKSGTLLRSLDDLRKTLVVVSHDMDFARAISDQVIYFEGGRAVESGTASEVFGNPQQPETRAFMACFQGRS
mgnify:CR=1 FL=1